MCARVCTRIEKLCTEFYFPAPNRRTATADAPAAAADFAHAAAAVADAAAASGEFTINLQVPLITMHLLHSHHCRRHDAHSDVSLRASVVRHSNWEKVTSGRTFHTDEKRDTSKLCVGHSGS